MFIKIGWCLYIQFLAGVSKLRIIRRLETEMPQRSPLFGVAPFETNKFRSSKLFRDFCCTIKISPLFNFRGPHKTRRQRCSVLDKELNTFCGVTQKCRRRYWIINSLNVLRCAVCLFLRLRPVLQNKIPKGFLKFVYRSRCK